jgi:hypothetical protein
LVLYGGFVFSFAFFLEKIQKNKRRYSFRTRFSFGNRNIEKSPGSMFSFLFSPSQREREREREREIVEKL